MKNWLTSIPLAAVLAVLTFGLLPARAGDPGPPPPAEPAEAPAEEGLPEEFKDRAYERYIDVAYLRDALAKGDPVGLADCALQLAEGERVLLRPHKAVTSDKLFRLAAKVAAEKRDKETLARLGRAAKELKNDELAKAVAAAATLAGGARKPDPSVSVALDQVRPETVVLYQSFVQEIKSAKSIGSKAQLDALETSVKAAEELDEKLRTPLLKQISDARGALPEKGDPELDVLARLAMASRGGARTVPRISVSLLNKTGGPVTFRVTGNDRDQSLPAGGPHNRVFAIPPRETGVVLILPQPAPHPKRVYNLKDGGKYQIQTDKGGLSALYTAQ
ncbi:MAG TPA: hypothetical protein VKA46_35920 [Gemmataceae bacterium]|nr:hypothetical protein [Gemmataceae bacterium]